ncbi:protoporphyrinogen/coproporphyrinogen oxidase [Nesterenkonia sp. PF2B19]|uniref:protoporphyrinogen/coproporphyrinogen oxidase n=1 Tax=Nesterenkonia sp. PF2B19 TaxID=1881858 RepID=UPI000A19E947|nr:FAD-dependent oxidoreductase [Nesterenkonia sp. PF2B19]OSM42944.1 hypothetical protein BCY76_011255 [Nesterenkonia sp. PF2B19]
MSRSVAVVGGGIAGLVVAWDLLRGGWQVTLLEAEPRLGGAIGTHRLGGIEVDAGAEAFATRSPAVPRLVEELGLGEQVIAPTPDGAWLQLPDLAAPLPATGILGIPADPLADDVVRILGCEAAERASADLTEPVEAWRHREDITVGELVLDRMGPEVLERLVTPIVSGVHSARPEELDVGNAAARAGRGDAAGGVPGPRGGRGACAGTAGVCGEFAARRDGHAHPGAGAAAASRWGGHPPAGACHRARRAARRP